MSENLHEYLTRGDVEWEHSRIDGGGEKLQLRSSTFGTLATAIRLPGTVCRIYWRGGRTEDLPRFGDAVEHIERHYGLS